MNISKTFKKVALVAVIAGFAASITGCAATRDRRSWTEKAASGPQKCGKKVKGW